MARTISRTLLSRSFQKYLVTSIGDVLSQTKIDSPKVFSSAIYSGCILALSRPTNLKFFIIKDFDELDNFQNNTCQSPQKIFRWQHMRCPQSNENRWPLSPFGSCTYSDCILSTSLFQILMVKTISRHHLPGGLRKYWLDPHENSDGSKNINLLQKTKGNLTKKQKFLLSKQHRAKFALKV